MPNTHIHITNVLFKTLIFSFGKNKIDCLYYHIWLSIFKMLKLEFISIIKQNLDQNFLNVAFCIQDAENEEIEAMCMFDVHDCIINNCRCVAGTNIGFAEILKKSFSIPDIAFQTDTAREYIVAYLKDNGKDDEESNKIEFEINKFMESVQVINLPAFTTIMLDKLSPKQLVYNCIVDYIESRKYMDYLLDDPIGVDYHALTRYENYHENKTNENYANIRNEYSWILEDTEFDEKKVHMVNKMLHIPLNVPLTHTIQIVESAYNELYSILSDYENPNGLLK
jgi:hypothetical protein